MEDTNQNTSPKFKPSKFTIQLKLLVIITSLLVLSLGTMIFLATYFFRKDNEIRIQENNIQLAEISAKNINTEIQAIQIAVGVALQSIRDFKQSTNFENLLLNSVPSILYVESRNKKGEVKAKLINQSLIMEHRLSLLDLQNSIKSKLDLFQQSVNGLQSITNLSLGFTRPIVAISFPNPTKSIEEFIIVIINAETFFESLHSYGITETMLVNNEGKIIFHNNITYILSELDVSKKPIIDRMLKSPIDNGQYRYLDTDGKYYIGSFKKLTNIPAGIVVTVPEDKAFEEVYNIQRRNLYLLIASLSVATIIIVIFSRKISEPILKLVFASHKIESGDYTIRLVPETRDEIGILTNSFNSMAKGLEEREKLKISFGKFVNEEIAELSMRGELKVGGDRKNCAILFSDMRGFTSISEKLRPEEVVELLNDYMSRMVKCIKSNNGYVDKFIGDAIMATWGSLKPIRTPHHDAVVAALEMRKALMEFNKTRVGSKYPKIKIGIGLNYGPVIAGQIGSEDKMEYTVIGDAVNVASRVESITKEFGIDIIVTDSIYEETKKEFKYQPLDSILVKGKTKPIQIYALLGEKGNSPINIDELKIQLGYLN